MLELAHKLNEANNPIVFIVLNVFSRLQVFIETATVFDIQYALS